MIGEIGRVLLKKKRAGLHQSKRDKALVRFLHRCVLLAHLLVSVWVMLARSSLAVKGTADEEIAALEDAGREKRFRSLADIGAGLKEITGCVASHF